MYSHAAFACYRFMLDVIVAVRALSGAEVISVALWLHLFGF